MLTNKIYPINLVIWHNLGIDYLLTAHNLKQEFCIEHYISKQRKNYAPAPQLNKENNHNLTRHSYQESKAKENIKNQQPFKNSTTPDPVIKNAQGIKQNPQGKNEVSALKPKALPLHEWPKVWKELLTSKNSAKVIWTYTGLGDDISGQGIPERKELIRRLIKELAFPAGTHAFWPLSLPMHEDQELNTQIFWSSAQMLEARAIVIMGSTALNAFNLPRKLRPLQQTVYNGYMLIVLPDINFLINEMQKYTPVREFIRTALKKYVQG